MNSKGHFWLSMIKSGIRIVSCLGAGVISIYNISTGFFVLVAGLAFSEAFGLVEEFVDKR